MNTSLKIVLSILTAQHLLCCDLSFARQSQILRPEYDNTMNHNSATSVVFVPYYHLAKPLDVKKHSEFHTLKSGLSLLFFELPLVSLSQTIVHELGHGFRGRDVGVSSRYVFGLPMPYSRLVSKQEYLGQALIESDEYLRKDETSLFEIGGLEANKAQANYLAKLSVESSIYDRPTANLYLVAKLSTPLYGLYSRKKRDIEGIEGLEKTRSKAWLNIIDPLILSTVLKNTSYINTGIYDSSFPWLVETQNFRWLPYLSYNIVPYGESFGFNNLMTIYGTKHFSSIEVVEYLGADQLRGFEPIKGYTLNYQAIAFRPHENVSMNIDLAIAKQPFYPNDDWQKAAMAYALGGSLIYETIDGLGMGAGLTRKTAGYFAEHTIHDGTIWKVSVRYPHF